MSDRAGHDEPADICIPYAPRDDDDSVDAWFADLVVTSHRSDRQVSDSPAIWEQILADFETLFGISRDDKSDPIG